MHDAAVASRNAPPSASTAPAATGSFGSLRTLAVLLLFLIGVGAGFGIQRVIDPPPPANPFPELPLVGEPAESAALVRVILADDARQLAAQLDQEILQALGEAMQPLDEVLEMKFVGATERQGEILAAYVANGRELQSGQSYSVGVVFRVQDGKVVGVN